MSDFWQIPDNGQIINLEHVVTVDRLTDGDIRVTTVCPGVWLTVKAGSDGERSLLERLGQRLQADSARLTDRDRRDPHDGDGMDDATAR